MMMLNYLENVILYRVYQNKSLLDLEMHPSFKPTLVRLVRSSKLVPKNDNGIISEYPYEFEITKLGIRQLFS